jgi:hypothetical protein
MTEPVCVEDGCTAPAEVERPATTEVVDLVCTEHEAPTQ